MSTPATINCLRCKGPIDANAEECPSCGDRVTKFQRTYSSRLLDGKYQIIDRLGVGGMGEIFKVRHIHLNELRVIKVMRTNIASDDQGLQRFLQEARTSTMIKHKNLAMLYDFAQLEDGSYYMVWEFIDGVNIQKWMGQHGPIPARLAVEIAIQALNGLEHLHAMGLIHRDISPENVMLSQDRTGKLLVKVIDFGIAKQLTEGDAGHGLTQTGMFLGKLKYASPEQAGYLKEGEHIDPRSDLYSFGILMYEMLAGRAPFNATNPHGYILKHVTEAPPPIAATNADVDVPPELEAIIMRSLEKDRARRFATAGEFAAELEAIRGSIAPDQKYGVGEKMVTLSAAQTLADLPKYTAPATTAGGAQQTQQTITREPVGPATRAAAKESTVVERSFTAPGMTRPGADEPTVLEHLDAAAGVVPTAPEEKWTGPSAKAEATVLERQIEPAEVTRKKNPMMLAAIAAIVVIALLVGGWFLMRKPKPDFIAVDTASTAGTVVTTTAATNTIPVPPGQGLLLLSASPWGDLEKIISKKDQSEIALTEELRSTPARIPLDPGGYTVVISGPKGTRTVDVQIETGKRTSQNIDMGSVDFDELSREVSKQ